MKKTTYIAHYERYHEPNITPTMAIEYIEARCQVLVGRAYAAEVAVGGRVRVC